MKGNRYETVDEYFAAFPPAMQDVLGEMRAIIGSAAPDARELISYNMPAFKLNVVLVYYAANKEHIGFYPTAAPIQVFKDELAEYKTSKGAIQFPLDKPIPRALVKKIVKYRVREDIEKAAAKRKKAK